MEEGGNEQGDVLTTAKNNLRNDWKKLIESEERLLFFKKMVGWDLQVREIEHLGDDLNNKFRSEKMKGARSEKEVVRLIMKLKLKDERRHQRELKKVRNERKKELEVVVSRNYYKKITSQINGEAKCWRKREKSKYDSKASHIKNIRKLDEEKQLETCPRELEEYRELKIFSKREMEKLEKEEVVISKIGKVELDKDELALLKLPPKFAVINKLDELDMKTDIEMAGAKMRYQFHREEEIRELEDGELEGGGL